jgi:hypothetical protein
MESGSRKAHLANCVFLSYILPQYINKKHTNSLKVIKNFYFRKPILLFTLIRHLFPLQAEMGKQSTLSIQLWIIQAQNRLHFHTTLFLLRSLRSKWTVRTKIGDVHSGQCLFLATANSSTRSEVKFVHTHAVLALPSVQPKTVNF